MAALGYGDLLARLKGLDEEANLSLEGNDRYYMIVAGGSALVLQKFRVTATHDIDAIYSSNELFPFLEKYDINTNVSAYINSFPYNFEDRAVLLHNGRKIDFYAASLEDIVIAKLNAMRPPNIADISSEHVLSQLDWELLEMLATDENEAKASALNDKNYNIFLDAYDDYVRRFRPCGN